MYYIILITKNRRISLLAKWLGSTIKQSSLCCRLDGPTEIPTYFGKLYDPESN